MCVGGRREQESGQIIFHSIHFALPNRSVPPSGVPRRRPESWPGSSVSPSNLGFSPSPTPPRSLPNFPPSPRPPGLGPYTLFSSRSTALLTTIQTPNNPSCHAEDAPFGRLSFFPANLLIPTVIELHSRTCGLCDPLMKNQWTLRLCVYKTSGVRQHLPRINPPRRMYERDARKDLPILAVTE